MRGKSHVCLGQYLAEHYMTGATRVQRRAFLIGCVEPDKKSCYIFQRFNPSPVAAGP